MFPLPIRRVEAPINAAKYSSDQRKFYFALGSISVSIASGQ
jgi:hypothetical protein